jgi:hypothetical protein
MYLSEIEASRAERNQHVELIQRKRGVGVGVAARLRRQKRQHKLHRLVQAHRPYVRPNGVQNNPRRPETATRKENLVSSDGGGSSDPEILSFDPAALLIFSDSGHEQAIAVGDPSLSDQRLERLRRGIDQV